MALISLRGVATRSDVLGLYDLLGDDDRQVEHEEETGQTLESEILESERALSAEVVFEELESRAEILGGLYPFRAETRGQSWRLLRSDPAENANLEVGRVCYVFCLLTSAIRDRRIQGANLGALTLALPNHFQAIATAAAGGVLGGDVVSFGWPRPTGTPFIPALHDLAARLELGTPHETAPLWSTGREKDSGIDVIAWKNFSDNRPGKLVLFGQVASGGNWTEKSVNSDTPRFLSWFSQHPTKHYIPAIFIPFPQHHDCAGRNDSAFSSVAHAQAWLREQEFGLVIDRLRIVGAAASHLTEIGAAADTLQAVSGWIDDALTAAKSET